MTKTPTELLVAYLTTHGIPDTPSRRTILSYLLKGSFVHFRYNSEAADPTEKADSKFTLLQHISNKTSLDYALVLDVTEELEHLGLWGEQSLSPSPTDCSYGYFFTPQARKIYTP